MDKILAQQLPEAIGDLGAATQKHQTAGVVRNAFKAPASPSLIVHHAINATLSSVSPRKRTRLYYRADDGMKLGDYSASFVTGWATSSHEHTCVDKWVKKWIGPNSYYLTLNSMERLFSGYDEWAASQVKERRKIDSTTNCPWELVLVAGQYEYSAFGIHNDKQYESVTHYNFGPGRKKFYLWDAEEHNHLGKLHYQYDIIPNELPNATQYEYGAGDCFSFFGPSYHVAASPGFSVSLVLSKKIVPVQQRLDEGLSLLMHKRQRTDFDSVTDFDHLSWREMKTLCLQAYQKSLESNGYLQCAAEFNQVGSSFAPWPSLGQPLSHDQWVRRLKPSIHFPLQWLDIGSTMILFLRGHAYRLKQQQGLKSALETLSSADDFSLSEIVDASQTNELRTLLTFLAPALYATKSVDSV